MPLSGLRVVALEQAVAGPFCSRQLADLGADVVKTERPDGGDSAQVGLGDLYPTEHLRLMAGVAALNGLLLVGWSASFTYLSMQEYWPMHGPERRGRHKHDRRERQG